MSTINQGAPSSLYRLIVHPFSQAVLLLIRGTLLWLLLSHLFADGFGVGTAILVLLVLHFDASPKSPIVMADYLRTIRTLPRSSQIEVVTDGVHHSALTLEENRIRYIWARAVIAVWVLRSFFYAVLLLVLAVIDFGPSAPLIVMFPWLLVNNVNDSRAGHGLIGLLRQS